MHIMDAKEIDEMFSLIRESSIDFPKDTLDPDVWVKSDAGYLLSPEVKDEIIRLLALYPDSNLYDMCKDIWIVGSMTTNLYQDDADVDVHLHLKDGVEYSEELQKKVMKWSRKHRKMISDNPVELYIQPNPAQDMRSDGVYDVRNDTWLKGPQLVDQNYNPYEVFAHVMDKVQEFAREADINLGELRRDVIDYSVIADAYEKLPADKKKSLRSYLDSKLQEIDADIEELLKNKKEWINYRRSTKVTSAPEDVMKDLEVVRQWSDVNAVFKFLSRYGLLKIISELEQARGEDKAITHDEVPAVAGIVGVAL